MSTYSNTAREVEMPNGDVVVLHNGVTANTTSNIKKFKYDDNGHVTESEAANATDLNLNSYVTPSSGSTDIGASDPVQTAIGKLDHQSKVDQSNILYGLQKVGTNIANVPEEQTVRSITFTRNSDGWITSNASSDPAAWSVENTNITIPLEAKNYTIVWELSSDSNDDVEMALFMPSGTVLFNLSATTSNRKATRAFTISSGDVGTYHIMYKTRTQKARLLVVETTVYNAYSEYQPYGAPNYDLTRLEAEDRAGLVDVVDSGAKNLLDTSLAAIKANGNNVAANISWNNNVGTVPNTGVSFTVNANGTITVNTSGAASARANLYFECHLPSTTNNVNYTLSSGGAYSEGAYYVAMFNQSESANPTASPVANFSSKGGSGWMCYLSVLAGKTVNNVTFSPMCCTKAAFGVSQKFVPYQWQCLGDCMNHQQAPTIFDNDSSSIILYHNPILHRCIAIFNITTKTTIASPIAFGLLNLPSGCEYMIPKGDVYEYFTADDNAYTIRIGKNSENRVGAFRALNGTVPANDNVLMQLEWTYI